MSPITLMRRFTEDIDRALSGFGGLSSRSTGPEQDFTWIPAVEINRAGNNLVITTDLPGVNEDDVRIEVTDDGLLIQGERKREETREEGGLLISERSYGRFYRLIPLPDNAKPEQARANFNNGVLEVTIPVEEAERTNRQIPIGAASGQQGQSAQQSQTGQQAQTGREQTSEQGTETRTRAAGATPT
jgi:HSP20 family protein